MSFRPYAAVVAALALLVGAHAAAQSEAVLFADDFDGGNSSQNWTVVSYAGDYVADFAFDYSTRGFRRRRTASAAPRSACGCSPTRMTPSPPPTPSPPTRWRPTSAATTPSSSTCGSTTAAAPAVPASLRQQGQRKVPLHAPHSSHRSEEAIAQGGRTRGWRKPGHGPEPAGETRLAGRAASSMPAPLGYGRQRRAPPPQNSAGVALLGDQFKSTASAGPRRTYRALASGSAAPGAARGNSGTERCPAAAAGGVKRATKQ